jgi:LacI family transcriptional regulator
MNNKKTPTIRDIARLADVSTTTVSHVINNTRNVSEELSTRVHEAVQNLEYKPNAMARALRVQATLTIGLIIPDNSNPFFSEIALGAEDCAFRHGYSLFLCNSRHDLARELTYLATLNSYSVDGLILSAVSGEYDQIGDLVGMGLPIVVVDRELTMPDVDIIRSDHTQGARDATQHLVLLGHRRIGLITGPTDLRPSLDRIQGYEEILEEHSIPNDPQLRFHGDFQVESGRKAARVLLEHSDPPTAIFACNDLMAIGTLQSLQEMGYRVPEDISLVGFDNIFITTLLNPPLTTVAQSAYLIGEMAVDRLMERMSRSEDIPAQEICLPTELIVRSSTRGL